MIDFESIELLEKIGSGASGQVFRGRQDGHEVAVKQLFSVMMLEELKEFEHEAVLMSRLNHPYICRFFGMTVSPLDELLLVLEYWYVHTHTTRNNEITK